MRYKPKSIAALQLALGGLPDRMRVEVDSDIKISAKTVGELRKVSVWIWTSKVLESSSRCLSSASQILKLL